MSLVVATLYWTAVGGLLIYGVNCYVLALSFGRHRHAQGRRALEIEAQGVEEPGIASPLSATPEAWANACLPRVTIQLPLYNERFVAERLLAAVATLRHPRDRLQIQVLDDSTDDTSEIVSRWIAAHGAGLDIEHRRRVDRTGFKAGALRDAMATATGSCIAIFDADFVPPVDFLERTLPFLLRPGVGLVQARWGHLNREVSTLTRAQALAIDGHFGIEQPARCWKRWLLNFNGTAGIWRRDAIDAAGGWQADTLTEDLDLSYRAQLAGWRIEYLPWLEVPAELPVTLAAFKSQQRRWAKGSIQTARKLLPRVLRADLPVLTKLQAVLHLTHYLVHPLMLAVALLAVPMLTLWKGTLGPGAFALVAAALVIGTCGPSTLYITSQRALRADWLTRLRSLPMLMLIGTGIAVSNTRAVIEAFLGIDSPFVRTPKDAVTDAQPLRRAGAYRLPLDLLPLFEAAMAGWSAWGLVLYLSAEKYLIGPFLLLYACGFGYVAWVSATETLRRLLKRRTSGRGVAHAGAS